MIVVRLTDGLGNQMFQYALGRHLSIRNNCPLRFDTSWFQLSDQQRGTQRTMTVDGFDIAGESATQADLATVLGLAGWLLTTEGHLRNSAITFSRSYPRVARHVCNYYREILGTPESANPQWAHRRRFCPRVLDISGHAYLHGYWQTPGYFDGIADTIRQDFTVPGGLSGTTAAIADQIETRTSVSIHVRRGDQIGRGPDDDPFGDSVPPSFYRDAADEIAQELSEPAFFVFSDDPEWVADNLSLPYPTTFVTHNDGSTDYLDITLMKRCNHYIIGNSTFSWWGAWLNPSPEKVVIAPTPWKRFSYPDGIIEEWDLLPADWRIREYEVDT